MARRSPHSTTGWSSDEDGLDNDDIHGVKHQKRVIDIGELCCCLHASSRKLGASQRAR
uniref:Uncharacterized protein n=1 Tax=Cucumis melo TaxID=3656 RepID=A0A9I9DYF8_CUCME